MEKLLTEEQMLQLRSLIDAAEKIVVCAHVGPDGDAVGSTLAIKHWLERCGKHADVVVPNQFPDFLNWMPGASTIVSYVKHEDEVKPIIEAADLFFIADMNVSSRLSDLEGEILANPAPKVMIDHHLNPSDFCQLVVSRPEMCATAEVLCHMLWQLDELDRISTDEATCLYAAMMCDTGAFTYNSNRPQVYECIGHLLEHGIDKDVIYRNVFWTWTQSRLRLTGYMLYVKQESMNEYHTSIMSLTNEERRMFGIKNGETEGLVNMPLQVSGTRLSVFLSEDTEKPGLVKISLRSVDDVRCDLIASTCFNGGGHKNASGGRLECSMDEALVAVRNAVKKFGDMLK